MANPLNFIRNAIRGGYELDDALTGARAANGTAVGDYVELEDVSGSAGLPAVDGSQLTGLAGLVIGSIIAVQDNLTGAQTPQSGAFIKLTAGLTGVGQYNEGLLTNESVTGSAPLIVATADINDAGSPMNGQTVNLINTENRYPMPGTTAGTVSNDHIQNITGGVYLDHEQGASMVYGGSAFGALYADANASSQKRNTYYSVNGTRQRRLRFDSSRIVRTSDHTNVKHIEVTYYMRIK